MSAELIAEAVDAACRIGWALAAWIAVFAAAGTVVVVGALATGAWAVPKLWRAMRPRKPLDAPVGDEQPAAVPESPGAAERRSRPSWATEQPINDYDIEEAA